MKDFLNQLVATRTGTCAVLLLAAFLEAYGDSLFQSGLHRTTGAARCLAFAAGAVALLCCGSGSAGPVWPHRQHSSVGFRQTARTLRCAVLSDGAGAGKDTFSAGADSTDFAGRFTDRGWRSSHHILEAVGDAVGGFATGHDF